PQARADTVTVQVNQLPRLVSQTAVELGAETVIPLAPRVGRELATNLVDAQVLAWGWQWQVGGLGASTESVLKAITLYFWPGGPSLVDTEQNFPVVWAQSRVAIDTTLSVGFNTARLDLGEQPVVNTPEPGTWLGVVLGLVALAMIRWGTR